MSTEDIKNTTEKQQAPAEKRTAGVPSSATENQNKQSPSKAQPAKRCFKPLRWLLYLFSFVVALLFALWVWSGQDGSLAQAISLAQRFSPVLKQSLTVENVQGSLRSGGHIGYLRWKQGETVDVSASNVNLTWDLKTLFQRHAQIDHLSIEQLQVVVAPSAENKEKRQTPLQQIDLPITIDVKLIEVEKFIYGTDEQGIFVTQTKAQYQFNGREHLLEVKQLNTFGAEITAHASLTAKNPELKAKLEAKIASLIPGSHQQAFGHATVNVQGPLTQLVVTADVQIDELKNTTPFPSQENKEQNTFASKTSNSKQQTKEAVAFALKKLTAIEFTPHKAHLELQIRPWEKLTIPHALLQLESINLSMLWPTAPQTMLSGQVDLLSSRNPNTQEPFLDINLKVQNERPGAINQNRLPVSSIEAKASLDSNSFILHQLNTFIDQGKLEAKGRVSLQAKDEETKKSVLTSALLPYTWQLTTKIDNIDLQNIYSYLDSDKINGSIIAEQKLEGLAYFVKIESEKSGKEKNLNNLHFQQLQAKGIWTDEIINLNAFLLKTNHLHLEGKGRIEIPVETDDFISHVKTDGQLKFKAPGIDTQIQISALTAKAGSITTHFKLNDAKETTQWIHAIRELPNEFKNYMATGSVSADIALQNGWENPKIDAKLDSPLFSLSQREPDLLLLQLKDLHSSLQGTMQQASLKLKLGAILQQYTANIELEGSGGFTNAENAFLKLTRLDSKLYKTSTDKKDSQKTPSFLIGTNLKSAVDILWQNKKLELSPGTVNLSFPNVNNQNAPSISWQKTTWKPDGELSSKGNISEFPALWLTSFSQTQFSGMHLKGDLMLKGEWHLQMGQNLDFLIDIGRIKGDLHLEQDTSAFSAIGKHQIKAGVKDFRLKIHNENTKLLTSLIWDTENIGTLDLALATGIQKKGNNWIIEPQAPLSGHIKGQLQHLSILSALAPMGWRFGGNIKLDAQFDGTVSHPAIKGQMAVSDVTVRSVLEGLEFQEGNLLLVFDGNQVRMETLSLKGRGTDGGVLNGKGIIDWSGEKPLAELNIALDKFKASQLSNRLAILSGQTNISLKENELYINGSLNVDKALIILADDSAPQLDNDVVIIDKNKPPVEEKKQAGIVSSAITPHLNITLNTGADFRVQGYGLQTYLEGSLTISNNGLLPQIMGQITTKNGKFRAYGQKLDIETGFIVFSGPYNNPTLNIMAIRPQTQEKVGVKVTGTAINPKVALYSASGLSDSDTLSWLLLGRAPSAGGTESAALQQAALALLSGDGQGSGLGKGIAGSIGLDEFSIGSGSNSLSGTTITIGKRLSDKFYVSYEQGLSGATSAFHVFYQVSKRLTLRAQAGDDNAVDVIYSFQFN